MNDVVKKKSRKKIAALTVGGVILAASVAAFAGARAHWQHGNHMSHAIEHVSDDLKLTDGQRTQLESLAAALLEAKQTLRSGNEADTVLAAVQGANLDQAVLNAMIESKLSTVREQAPLLVNSVAQFYDSLDTGQQAKAREKLEHMAQWMRSHRHGHDHD